MCIANGTRPVLAAMAADASGILAGVFGVQTNPEWIGQTSGTSAVLLGVAFTDANTGYASGRAE